MMLSAEDEVTLAEVGVILVGIAITWAVYRHGRAPSDPSRPARLDPSTRPNPRNPSPRNEGE